MTATIHDIVRIVNGILKKIGINIIRYPLAADRRRQALMKRHGISTVVDIGANVGRYAERLRDLHYSGRIISFEPLPVAYSKLARKSKRDDKWQTENYAIGPTSESVLLNVATNSESSSLLPMLKRHLDAAPDAVMCETAVVRQKPLENVLDRLQSEIVMIKIDTQGYEREVIGSAGAHLPNVALIELEVSLQPLYEGQALFLEMDAILQKQGFSLVSLEEGFFDAATGELLQLDAIYANRRKEGAG
jgi:FkbM family methyltransferase